MNWYVLDTRTKAVAGPMTQELAFAFDEGFVFNQELFEPKFAISGAIEELLGRLRKAHAAQARIAMRGRDNLLVEAAEAIFHLSREKIVTGVIESGILTLDEVPEGVTVDIRDYDIEGSGDEDLKEDESGRQYFPIGIVGSWSHE